MNCCLLTTELLHVGTELLYLSQCMCNSPYLVRHAWHHSYSVLVSTCWKSQLSAGCENGECTDRKGLGLKIM